MRIHILTLSLRQKGGGSHHNLITMVRVLRTLGHSVVVRALYADGNDPPHDILLAQEAAENKATFLSLQKICAAAMMRSEDDADVYLNYGQALIWGAGLYRKTGRVPTLVYIDSHLDAMKTAYSVGVFHFLKHLLWEKFYGLSLARYVDRYIAVSPYLMERYIRFGFPREKFSVVPNFFDLSGGPKSREGHTGDIRILSVSRFSPEKGVDVLVEALSGLPDEPVWRARLVGEGPEKEHLAAQIHSSPHSGRMEQLPWMRHDELSHEYASADIFVNSARIPEPFGRTIVEAMHAGVPVIIPQFGGAAWVAGEAGVTFQNGDARSLRRAIVRLLNDRTERQRLGEAGRKRARVFSGEIVGVRLAAELEEAVRKQP